MFLEHGAHYAIGALAFIMIASGTGVHVPEVVTGLIGVAFIVWAVIASNSIFEARATVALKLIFQQTSIN